MLTKKQRQLLLYIHEQMSDSDVAPSFDEMKEALGLKSKSGIHRLITALEERGYLERLPQKARALAIKKLPAGLEAEQAASSPPSSPLLQSTSNDDVVDIPLYGKIAAGTPIEAIRDEGTHVQIPATMISRAPHYALTVDGDSMIEAGIHDGDTVLIQKCDTAEPGTIIVALVDGEEVTLKTLGYDEGKVALIPHNAAHKTRVLSPDRVRIQGKLSALMRQYH